MRTLCLGLYLVLLGFVCLISSANGQTRITPVTSVVTTNVQLTPFSVTGANGQATTFGIASESLTCASGATCATSASLIPAGALVLGVTTRVTTLITGATSYSVGDGTDPDRWGSGLAVAATTTSDGTAFTISSPVYYTAATKITLTAAGSNFTAGVIRIAVHYVSLTAPTS